MSKTGIVQVNRNQLCTDCKWYGMQTCECPYNRCVLDDGTKLHFERVSEQEEDNE